jgi:rubrerythrin
MASSFSPTSWHVSSVEDLMALAEAQERWAAMRYDQLAALMDRFGSRETAALFRRLAAMEREHVEALSGWGDSAAQQGKIPDGMGEGTAIDSDEVPASLTPYRALAIAVRNEERAFSLLTYVAAHAGTSEIRARAEALALEELQHVALLRAQRRRAFHAERHDMRDHERDIETAIRSTVDLRKVAGKLLSRAVEIHEGLARELVAIGDQRRAGLMSRLATDELAEARRLGIRYSGSEARTAGKVGTTGSATPYSDAMRPVEDMVDILLAVAERSKDEEVVREAQRLGGLAITWLAELRAYLEATA